MKRIDIVIYVLGVICITGLISVCFSLDNKNKELKEKIKFHNSSEVYIPTLEEKAISNEWIENLERTHKETTEVY